MEQEQTHLFIPLIFSLTISVHLSISASKRADVVLTFVDASIRQSSASVRAIERAGESGWWVSGSLVVGSIFADSCCEVMFLEVERERWRRVWFKYTCPNWVPGVGRFPEPWIRMKPYLKSSNNNAQTRTNCQYSRLEQGG